MHFTVHCMLCFNLWCFPPNITIHKIMVHLTVCDFLDLVKYGSSYLTNFLGYCQDQVSKCVCWNMASALANQQAKEQFPLAPPPQKELQGRPASGGSGWRARRSLIPCGQIEFEISLRHLSGEVE